MTITTQSGYTITLEPDYELDVIDAEGWGLYALKSPPEDETTVLLYQGDRWTCERLLVELEAELELEALHFDVRGVVERLLERVA